MSYAKYTEGTHATKNPNDISRNESFSNNSFSNNNFSNNSSTSTESGNEACSNSWNVCGDGPYHAERASPVAGPPGK